MKSYVFNCSKLSAGELMRRMTAPKIVTMLNLHIDAAAS